MPKFICQSDVKHIMSSPIKTITLIRLAEILMIISVSIFKIVVILYYMFVASQAVKCKE